MKPDPKVRRTAAVWGGGAVVALLILYFALAPWAATALSESDFADSDLFEKVFVPAEFVYERVGLYEHYADWFFD